MDNTSQPHRSDLAALLAEIALSQVGTLEVGTNSGEAVEEYQRASWLSPGPWAWCAAFDCWCIREWLEREDVRDALGLRTHAAAEKWRLRETRAHHIVDWARKRGLQVFDETAAIHAGDIIVYDFPHTGIAVTSVPAMSISIDVVEGNTNKGGGREGDGVYRKVRQRTLIQNVIRIL